MKKNTQINSRLFRFTTVGSAGTKFAGKSLRQGYDIIAPGCRAEDVTTEVNLTRRTIKVTIANNPRPPFDLDGKVDKFGFNKAKAVIIEDLIIDDKYDIGRVFVSCHNGIVRVFAVVPDADVELVDGVYRLVEQDDIVEVAAIDLD